MDYAIGDVHGCFNTLKALLKKINFKKDRDRLFFLGDCINRGSQSLDTLRFIKNLQDNAQLIIGNHEYHFLSSTLTKNNKTNKDTFDDITNSKYKNELIDYLITRPFLIQRDNILMLHAGVPPQWTKEILIRKAKELEAKMQSKDVANFIYATYQDTPFKESLELNEIELLTYAINAITRIRFCKADGELEFKHKFKLKDAPDGFKAWFMQNDRKTKGLPIIFGHWSSLKNIQEKNIYPMDSGCVWGNELSAINLENYEISAVKKID